MKHIRKHLRNISKETIKKTVTGIVLLFFATIMIFQKDAPKQEIQFIWNADTTKVHNAASQQWDYLFQDEWGQDTYQGQMNTGTTTETTTGTINNLIHPDETTSIINSQTGQIYTGTLVSTWTIKTTGEMIPNTITVTTKPLDCITPWNETVKNNDFVLAYQQREDVDSICNVEKRTCTNGILWGTFIQSSCKEDIVYTYTKTQVVSYNQKVLNPYIQPTAPVNQWANFDTQWKINTTQTPTTTRGTSRNEVTPQSWISQIPSPKIFCLAPRGQIIQHGQFVKAYKAPRGFIDMPCEVEIRACVDGNLKGTFTYSKCTFNNTTYTDYLNADSPSTNNSFLFFDRIKSIFY